MKYIFITLIIIALGIVGVLLFDVGRAPSTDIVVNSFEECAAHYPIQESYPRRCVTPTGESFIESVATSTPTTATTTATTTPATNTKPLTISNLKSGQTISSPFTVTGKAPGPWFFEASFPIRVLDSAGKEVGRGIAQADGEWMTTDDVAFTAKLTFTATSGVGSVVFEKDNPSGLPENDAHVTVPVRFGSAQ